ncbi:T9SS type A sorting domain-containing protein [Flavicella marina]|uniref:T9SS type A sorting domain-containing protein n=1 Tax=Flavicella marina TaxID=1475951 RepID=UPI0012642BF0|nr:T9SS type A sorting domain-containing protein [Flavicella marina]
MKTNLLFNSIIFTLSVFFSTSVFSQNIEYSFDGNSWEGWLGGTSATWNSTFANNPNGALDITYAATAKNIVMYSPSDTRPDFDGTKYKFFQIKISNRSSQVNQFRVRGRLVNDGAWFNAIDVAITTDGDGEFTTYDFEIDAANWLNTDLSNWQVIFRKSDNSEVTDGEHIYVDNILLSDSSTASVNNIDAFDFGIYPNPVNDELTISTEETIESVQVLDLVGKTVISSSAVNGSVNVSGLKSGIYVVKVNASKGSATSKFVKK